MIRVLQDGVVNKIAAGEVVERPASVVKELVENALDAGARTLRVELRSGGRNLVQVSDDGCGMNRADATLCIERHATSKIRTDADLFAITTLGFRGEAMPSIAAVSRFELLTRPAAAPVGTRLVMDGGTLVRIEDAGGPPGTQVSARNLFFNVPARRKFLRTVPTELAHCLEAVVREVLLRPELDITVEHDGKTPLRAPVVADLATRAGDLLGPHGRALVPVSFARGTLEVEGLLSPVGVHRASAQGCTYLYVNGRYVADPVLRRAVREAYRGIVPVGRHPTVVLHVKVPPEHVDVNVHPSKTEVRFQHGRELSAAVAAGIREALQRHGIQQPVAPRPRFGAELRPTLGGRGQLSLPPMPQPAADPSGSSAPPPDTLAEAWTPSWPAAPPPEDSGRGPARGLLPVPRFIDLRVLGQLDRTYILCEGQGELVILDQHAAHERVTLHRLMQAEAEHLGPGQRLLHPVVVELSVARALTLAGHVEALHKVGLEIAPFGGSAIAIKQLPKALSGADPQRLIEDVADDLADGGSGEAARNLSEKVLATMACHSSVRAGQTLSPYEMRELLRALDQVDFSVCAHGRPVCIRVSPAELERRFHRS